MDARELLKDPSYLSLPETQKAARAESTLRTDPRFLSLPDAEKAKVLNHFVSGTQPTPTPQPTPRNAAGAPTDARQLLNNPAFMQMPIEQKRTVAQQYLAKDPRFQALPEGERVKVLDRFAPQQTSRGAYYLNAAKAGLADTAGEVGLITDIATYPARKLAEAFGATHIPSATKIFQKAADKTFGVKRDLPPPRDVFGQTNLLDDYAKNIIEFTTGSALPGMGLLGKEISAAKAAAKAADLAGTEATKFVTKKVASFLGRYMAGNISSGVWGSDAGIIAKNMAAGGTPQQQAQAQAIGTALGATVIPFGISAALGGATGLAKGAAAEMDITPPGDVAGRKIAAEKVVKSRMGPHFTTSKAAQNVAQAKQVAAQIPGFGESLTAGRQTNSPYLIALEEQAARRPSAHETAVSREAGLHNAINEFIAKKFPSTGAEPHSKVQAEYDTRLEAIGNELRDLQRKQRAMSVSPQESSVIGDKIRALAGNVYTTATKKKTALYDKALAELTRAKATVPTKPIRDAAAEIARDSGRAFQNDPGVVGQILRRYGVSKRPEAPAGATQLERVRARTSGVPTPADTIPYAELDSLIKKVNTEYVQTKARSFMNPSEAQKLPVLQKLRATLANLEDVTAANVKYGKGAKMLAAAKDYYKNTYKPQFKQGVMSEIMKINSLGEHATDSAKIMSNLVFRKGSPDAVREFLTAAGNTTASHRLLEQGAMDVLFSKLQDGKLTPQKLADFKRDNRESLALLPNLDKKLTDLKSTLTAMEERRAELLTAKKELTQSTLAKVAGTERPDQVITKALASPSYLDTLLAHQDANTKTALANGMAQKILESKDPHKLLDMHKAPLLKTLGKTRLDALRTIADAKLITSRVKSPAGIEVAGEETDPLKKLTGTAIPGAASTLKAIGARVGSSKLYLTLSHGMKWFSKFKNEDIRKLEEDVLFNPNAAEQLANMITGKAPKWMYKMKPEQLMFAWRGLQAYSRYKGAQP